MKKRHSPAENTLLVIAVAIAFFGGVAGLALASGLHHKLSAGELAVLAIFASGFAILTYACDQQVRSVVDRAIAGLRDRFARRDRTRGRPANIRTRSAS
jgi:hypothetical protein